MSKHEPYSEEPPIDYSVAYLREYYKRRNRGMIEERNKDLEKRLMEVEKRLGIQNWPDPHLRRCTKCGHEEEGAWDNQCPNLYCSGGFTEKERV